MARLRHTRDIAHPIIEIMDSTSSSVAGYASSSNSNNINVCIAAVAY